MYNQSAPNPGQTVRVDAYGIFPKGISSLRPSDYNQIALSLRSWFFNNTTGHRLDMPHLGFEVG